MYAEIGANLAPLKRGLADTKAQLQRASGDFLALGRSAKMSFGQIAGGLFLVATAARGINAAFNFGRAGAFLEFTEAKFARLAAQIGTTADALERDLGAATRGMVSDAEAMSLATSLMALGLAKTHDEAVRLARVTAGLGMDVGELVLALTNQTTRRFDQLGVSVEGFEQRLKDLKATGLSTEDAFKMAFLQQAEMQLENVGEVADATAGSFVRLEAALADAADAAKKAAAAPFAGVADAIYYILKGEELLNDTLADHAQNMRDAGMAGGEYADEILEAAQRATLLTERQRNLGNLWQIGAISLGELNTQYGEEGVVLSELIMKYGLLTDAVYGFLEAAQSSDRAMLISAGIVLEQEAAVFDLNAALDTLALTIDGPLGRAYEEIGQEQRDMLQQYAQLRDAIAFFEGQPQTDEGIAELAALRTEMANVEQAIIDGSAAFDEQTRRILFDIVLQRLAIAELPEDMRAAAFSMVNDLAFAWGLIDQTTWEATGRIDQAFALLAQGNVQAAKQALFELGGWANSVAGDYYIRFHVQVDQAAAWEQAGMPDEGQGGGGVGGAANDLFPPGSSGWVPPSFSPPDFGGGGVADLPELPPTLAQMAAPFTDTANALSQIGNFFADQLQEELIDPLQAKIDAIDTLLSPQHIDMVARERALELEQERVLAAEELAEAQEKLLALQKAQSELQFLEYQIKLLDLIQEHGLNADDILGGLKLGIDADAGEVIQAITKAIQALIAQAEEELGIASPSKVAAEWGAQIIRGLVVGVQGEMAQLAQVPADLSEALFMEAGVAVGPRERGGAGCITINVYPSEGMNETDLARKVGAEVRRKLL